jgi:hypothetical protein
MADDHYHVRVFAMGVARTYRGRYREVPMNKGGNHADSSFI